MYVEPPSSWVSWIQMDSDPGLDGSRINVCKIAVMGMNGLGHH